MQWQKWPMKLVRAFFDSAIDALFPIHPAESEVFDMGAERAFRELPRAPRGQVPEACSVFHYKDERVSRLIWSIKYKKSRAGAEIAGYALYRILRLFSRAVPSGMRVVVVPMPITKARRRERGFNQCELILDEIEKLEKTERPDSPISLLFAHDLLLRIHHKSRQTLKDREERLSSVKNLFIVNEKSVMLLELRKNPNGYFIVVIDDVITTGSTIKDAIDTLRRAGFENTYGLSVAH
jgi:predicted amidophosphoribosyltransferase